ncbi:SCP2 sterol-binding domain-containing protein [Roseiterribacter gracilis]|uniref:Sterol-binding protein n=1 Tax=Roseiterribacter gracilis TaxID=2812848 RepID=A0A8S8XG03_9PROT|nr:sterol-binding protein [Rhodospirillales bacterium TMPK1]
MSLEDLQQKLAMKARTSPPLGKTVKFDLGADGALRIEGQTVLVDAGAPADTTITMTRVNFEKLLAGDLDPTLAFMTGKLKVAGDMGVAMKLSSLLED